MGLKVRAVLNTKTYPTGAKISDERMKSLSIRKGRALPQWNYIIRPRRNVEIILGRLLSC